MNDSFYYVVQVWSEWDLGIPEFFESKGGAMNYLEQYVDWSELDYENLQEVVEAGLLGFKNVKVMRG